MLTISWNFLQPSYWCGERFKTHDASHRHGDLSDKGDTHFEADPTDMKVGISIQRLKKVMSYYKFWKKQRILHMNQNIVNSHYLKRWYPKVPSDIKEYRLGTFSVFLHILSPDITSCWYLKVNVLDHKNLLWTIGSFRLTSTLSHQDLNMADSVFLSLFMSRNEMLNAAQTP